MFSRISCRRQHFIYGLSMKWHGIPRIKTIASQGKANTSVPEETGQPCFVLNIFRTVDNVKQVLNRVRGDGTVKYYLKIWRLALFGNFCRRCFTPAYKVAFIAEHSCRQLYKGNLVVCVVITVIYTQDIDVIRQRLYTRRHETCYLYTNTNIFINVKI